MTTMTTKTSLSIKNFGFIGFGLIGGSIAHALKEQIPGASITAFNYYETKKHPKLEQAKSDGILTDISTNLADFSNCDMIFLCAPVLTNIKYLKRLKPFLSKECIITDVGSVKGNIHKSIHELDLDSQFIGGHPMAGSEKTGYQNSSSSFLKDAYYILTPTDTVNPIYVTWMESLFKQAGSHVVLMNATEHDQVTAAISHGPHVISASLVNTVHSLDTKGLHKQLAAGGFKDITRISSSSPEMWQNVCLSNKEQISCFLDNYINTLLKAKNALDEENSDALMKLFSDAKNYRDEFK